MPIDNITIDDASPFVSYQGVWSDTSTVDPEYVDYTNKTFHCTQTLGSSASLTFNGTGVYVYGAKRADHGAYIVTLDGHVSGGNGYATPDIFQQLLFSNVSLSPGPHTVTLANADDTGLYVDLDFIVITAGDGSTTTMQSEITLDDTDPAFSYDASWGATNSSNATLYSPFYYDQTLHATCVPNATARISFTGNAIDLYGATFTNHGAFAVSLDGGAAIVLNGTAPTFRPQTLLYRYDELEDTEHVLSVMNFSPNPTMCVDLDYAVVSRYTKAIPPASVVPSSASATTFATPVTITSGTHSTSTMDGVVAGALAILVLVGLVLWAVLVRMRRRAWARAAVQNLDMRENQFGRNAALSLPAQIADTIPPPLVFSPPSLSGHAPRARSEFESSETAPPVYEFRVGGVSGPAHWALHPPSTDVAGLSGKRRAVALRRLMKTSS